MRRRLISDSANPISGLSAGEVAARKARGEVNVPPPSPGRSYRQIILGNIFSFINNVFYVLCLLLVLLGRPLDAILPLVVLANAGVSVFQEVRAKRKLDQIALLTRPTWLAIVLLLGLLAIAVVPPLSGIFDLRPVKPLDAAVIAAAAAVWVFLVRWAWRRRLLERFVGTDLDR